jgi:Vitamin K-dependent gamma-carboxylase
MHNQPAETTALPAWMRSWERFWFTPLDPTQLAMIRILCGMIAFYTFIVYGITLQDTVGAEGWVELKLRQEHAHDRPISVGSLWGSQSIPRATTPEQKKAIEDYRKRFGFDLRNRGLKPPADTWEWNYLVEYTEKYKQPPTAYAATAEEARTIDRFRAAVKKKDDDPFLPDPRINGLKPPANDEEWDYALAYTLKWGEPPPAYAASPEEAAWIDDYRQREEIDPRVLYTRGSPIWSIWMHVTDPIGMAIVQCVFVLAAFLCMIGLGTRVTTALTWFASLSYIHRNPQILFGADTMMSVLLLYLTIGPSGAALSVDRLLGRWWRGETGPARPPQPSVSANVAIRLLQIHVCIVYLMAGLSKLQGPSWWSGSALWYVLANYEFAPMQFSIYNDILRFVCRNQIAFELVLTGGCYFTLAFEIGYIFLVWWRKTRWVVLGGAILLHGTIGLFMGLKTFSLLMLVMNLAFVRPEEVRWVLGLFTGGGGGRKAIAPVEPVAVVGATRLTKN